MPFEQVNYFWHLLNSSFKSPLNFPSSSSLILFVIFHHVLLMSKIKLLSKCWTSYKAKVRIWGVSRTKTNCKYCVPSKSKQCHPLIVFSLFWSGCHFSCYDQCWDAPKLWNTVLDIKEASSLNTFKRKLKTHLVTLWHYR